MNPKPTNSTDKRYESLTHLAAGELGGWQAWRLRRRIADNPELAREWAMTQQLWTELGALRSADAPVCPVLQNEKELRKPMMKRRLLVTAAAFISLLVIAGARIVADRLTSPFQSVSFSFEDGDVNKGHWRLSGSFRGKVIAQNADRTKKREILLDGNDPHGNLLITVYPDGASKSLPVSVSLQGLMEQTVIDKSGAILGYVLLKPLTNADQKALQARNDEYIAVIKDYVRRPERVSTVSLHLGGMGIVQMPGLVGSEQFYEPYNGIGKEKANRQRIGYPVAWKVYGLARVKAEYFSPGKTIHPGRFLSDVPKDSKLQMQPKVLSQTARSGHYPTKSELESLPIGYEKMLPAKREIPEVYWSIGEDTSESQYPINRETGDWKKTLDAGKFTGYGRHIVRDKQTGKTILILDVSPLPQPNKPAK